MEQKQTFQFGPALAIVIIVAVVAIAGIYFYKSTISQLRYDSGATVVVPEGYFDPRPAPVFVSTNEDLSTSTDLESIETDLDATVETDLGVLDDIDAELLNFEDLDDFDFEI